MQSTVSAAVESPDFDLAPRLTRTATNYPANILVVDDEAAIRRLNSLVLSRAGYHVDEAKDGLDGWEAARTHLYDLIITDNQMPGLSGLEFVERLRAARMTMPVVLASGTLDAEELRRHQWLALAATLPKPHSGEQLLATVKGVLRPPVGAQNRHQSGYLYLPESLGRIQPFPRWGINE